MTYQILWVGNHQMTNTKQIDGNYYFWGRPVTEDEFHFWKIVGEKGVESRCGVIIVHEVPLMGIFDTMMADRPNVSSDRICDKCCGVI